MTDKSRSNINNTGNYEMIEHDDMVEVSPKQVSIDESSSDDDQCRPMSDSDLANVDCTDQIARQVNIVVAQYNCPLLSR
jgi:hypothetical protein